jgi:hypothetical protein
MHRNQTTVGKWMRVPVRAATSRGSSEGGNGSSSGPHPASGSGSIKSSSDSIFNCVQERQFLQTIAAQPPTNVLLLLGPVSAGKTALLQHMVQRLGRGNVVYLDGRTAALMNPAGTRCTAM